MPSRLFAIAACAVFFSQAAGAFAGAGARDWELVFDRDGVRTFRRKLPGSPIESIKGSGVVPAPVRSVALVLLDDARAPEWVDSLAEARVVRVMNPFEYIEYNHATMPAFIADRDFVTQVSMHVDREHQAVVIISEPSDDPAVPVKRGVVRGALQAVYDLRPIDGGRKTLLTVETHTDPKGLLPAWVVNFFEKDWAINTIAGIRGQAQKSDLKPPAEFAEFLSQIDF